ncbi:MAG: PIN domain-containing protein [Puia sp.]|nr:PIN domain-containing protein [Puia sp.]
MLPLYLLLDNNALLALVSSDFINENLDKLYKITKSGHVRLLLPDPLQKEWEKHREIRRKEIQNLTKNSSKLTKTLHRTAPKIAAMADFEFQLVKEDLLGRISMLDEIITTYSDHIPKSNEKNVQILELKDQGKAPFHKKDTFDNLNDAAIIYYSIDFVFQKKLSHLFFVSFNSEEFSDENNKNILHPDYVAYCPDVNIHFSLQIADIYKEMERWGLDPEQPRLSAATGSIIEDLYIDRSLPVIMQALIYLKARIAECSLWPKSLLTEHYPFITASTFNYIHKPFTLITDNEEFYNLMTNVRVEDGQVTYLNGFPALQQVEEDALKEVMLILTGQLLFRIGFKIEREVSLQYTRKFSDNDVMFRQYYNLDFKWLLVSLRETKENQENDSNKQLSNAYYFYKTQQYAEAARILLKLRKEPNNLSLFQRFIVHFNLPHIGRFLEVYGNEGPEIHNLISECKAVKWDQKIPHSGYQSIKALIAYVEQMRFLNGPLLEMTNNLDEIRRLHSNKSFGGSSAAHQLIEEYFQATSFLSENFIIYDAYSEFQPLIGLFTQGILLSIDCSPHLSGKIPYMDDSFASELMLQGKGEEIIRLVNEYSLLNLPYERNNDRPPFYETLSNLLNSHYTIQELIKNLPDTKIPFFSQELDKFIFNGLVLAAICQLPVEAVQNLFNSLLYFLRQDKLLNLYNIKKGIRSFITQQQDKITLSQWMELLRLALINPELKDDNIFETIGEFFRKSKTPLSITIEDVTHIEKLVAENAGHRVYGWDAFCILFEVIENGEAKEILRTFAETRLNEHFTTEGYYMTRLYDVLPLDEALTKKYFEETNKIMEANSGPFPPRMGLYNTGWITQIVNFCWKFDIALPDFLKPDPEKFGFYYSWLIDIDNFDYSKFDPEWPIKNFTRFYKKRYRRSEVLRKAMLEVIKNRKAGDLARIFALTYGEKDGEDIHNVLKS